MGNLKKWMGFCVLKAFNWFFRFSWKEKTCLLSAVNIEHENFDTKSHIGWFIGFFMDFFGSLKDFLKKGWKTPKNGLYVQRRIYFSKFLYSMFAADKRRVFSFHESWKNEFKAFKTQKPIHFFNCWKPLRSINDCSVKSWFFPLKCG